MDRLGMLRFVEAGTVSMEGEIGSSANDSINLAIQLGIQSAVREMIEQGVNKGLWDFRN